MAGALQQGAGSAIGGGDLSTLDYAPKRSLGGIAVVIGLHLLLAWALVSGLAQRAVDVIKAPIETRLIEEVKPEPPPPPPVLPPPTTPPPTMAQVPVPVVIPQTVPPPTPMQAPPPPVMAPPPPPPPVPQTTAPVEAIRPPAAPAAATTRHASPEELYVSGLRAHMNSIKRYPTGREARQLRPQGTVKVWISIDRSGQLLDSGVESSSGVLLLDNEALRTVRNSRYPPVPPEAYAGLNSIRFAVDLEYLPPGN